MDVMAELRPIGALYTAGEFRSALGKLALLWAEVPDPKSETSNAYLIVEYGVALSLKEGDLKQASEWAERAPMFAEKRHDLGEVEFLIGKVAFACGDTETARKQFSIANVKSEGRMFEGEDQQYQQLIS